MQKELKYIDGTSDKFWKIETTGAQYTVTYGRNGTPGTSQTKTVATEADCLKTAEKLIAEKIKKGYSETGDVDLTSTAKTPSEKVDLQAIFDEYDLIIKTKNKEALLVFLQEKLKGNISNFKKHLKKCKDYWLINVDLRLEPNYREISKNMIHFWGKRADLLQEKMVSITAIAILDKSEIGSWGQTLDLLCEIKSDPFLQSIINWAKPKWIGDYLLTTARRDNWQLVNYHTLRYLEKEQIISFEPELYARSISLNMEYRSKLKPLKYIHQLTEDTTAIERDIPLLFEYETELHSMSFVNYEDRQNIWDIIFKILLKEEKINRLFLIEKILQIQTKDWSNNLKVFFRKILDDMAIQPTELIENQNTLFSLLQFPLSAIVGYSIDQIKSIVEHPQFNSDAFLEWVEPVMMREDCKTALKKLVSIFEKLHKHNPKLNSKITALLADIFMIADLGLQEKAAKTLLKIANKKDAALKEKLSMYIPQMQGDIKGVLKDFLLAEELENAVVEQENYTYNKQPKTIFHLTNEVVLPKDWNEILFQFGTFISSKEVIDAELLLNVFATQRHLLPNDYSEQLQPYVKQLHKKYFSGDYQEITKGFLIEKTIHLHQKFQRDFVAPNKTLSVAKELVYQIDVLIKKDKNLPLLSFPTHLPYWVAPKTLLERIIAYQEAKEELNLTDLSVAICRMPREKIEEALPLLDKIPMELKPLFEYCFGLSKQLNFEAAKTGLLKKVANLITGEAKSQQIIALWAVAARTYSPDGVFDIFDKTDINKVPFVKMPFGTQLEFKERWTESKAWNSNEMIRSTSWWELTIPFYVPQDVPSNLLYSLDVYKKPAESPYAYSHINLSSEENVYYWNSLMPQNNDALALNLLRLSCGTINYSHLDLKGFLHLLNQPAFTLRHLSSCVFACCFFQDKKDLRLMAAEVWYNLVEDQRLNLQDFGKTVAYLMNSNYSVFYRFPEVLIPLKDSSPAHNSALFILFDNILQHLDQADKLPTNFKKFLENYVDLLTKTKHQASSKTNEFLSYWESNASLKKLIAQIIKK